MHSNGDENARLAGIVKNFGTPKILVVGDLMLDHYVYGKAGKVSQEAPVMALEWEREEWRLGGSANVALMCKALGAEVTVAGVRGHGPEGIRLIDQIKGHGIHGIIHRDDSRPTTVKHRYIGQSNGSQGQQVLRVDRESRESVSDETWKRIFESLEDSGGFADADVIIFSDYGKGVVQQYWVKWFCEYAKMRKIPVIADPCRNVGFEKYRGCTAVTPNREELKLIGFSGGSVRRSYDLDALFLTKDADGIELYTNEADFGGFQHFPTRPRTVYDVTGAGDAVLAMIGMCYANQVSPEDAARLANVAGGLEVERLGCVPITREEVIADLGGGIKTVTRPPFFYDGEPTVHEESGCSATLKSVRKARRAIQKIKPMKYDLNDEDECILGPSEFQEKRKRRVVFTNGCFDLLHAGHVAFLEAAKREGDYLIVAVNSDKAVRELKGKSRPIVPLVERTKMIGALKCVDEVRIQHCDTPHVLLHQIKPDVLVKGEPYRDISEVVGHEIVEAYGGMVKILPGVPGLSTTEILRRIRQCSL